MDSKPDEVVDRGGITRQQLEAVIRRAAEIYAAEADADERISEDELLRIAAELGLPARHVRQALLELPTTPAEPSITDRVVGPAHVNALRAVPEDAAALLPRLEEYLTAWEYLRVERRRGGQIAFAPADDIISQIARGLFRPSGRHHLSRARRTLLVVEPIEPGRAHVKLELDLHAERRGAVGGGMFLGTILGGVLGTAAFMVVGGIVSVFTPGTAAAVAAGSVAGVATLGGTLWASLSVVRSRFQRRLASARNELEGLLDRLERGERLEPPPTPWRRRLGLHAGATRLLRG